jgi:hypothetical protein
MAKLTPLFIPIAPIISSNWVAVEGQGDRVSRRATDAGGVNNYISFKSVHNFLIFA